MAFTAKRTIERGGFFGYRLVALAVFAVLTGGGAILHISARSQLWQPTLVLSIVCDFIVLVGLAFTVWARIVLGRNWSAEVTFKEGHELIVAGPYALARHPIYTGLIAMALGTAVNYGRPIGFALLCAICGALWWKARQEEQVMSSHFPDAYREYKTRVHAILPFVL